MESELTEKIKALAEKEAALCGLRLHKAYFSSEQGRKTLHLEVDKKGGVTLAEVTEFTEAISPELDKIEELDFSYDLDCSSPGAERIVPIGESDEHMGEYMEISAAGRKYLGTLISADENTLTVKRFIKGRPKKEVVRREDVEQIQLRIKL